MVATSGIIHSSGLSTSANVSPRSTWGRMGYDPASDNGAPAMARCLLVAGTESGRHEQQGEAEERWDLLGVGLILKAWGWQVLTDLHGEIVIQEAIDPSKMHFTYDTQEFAYEEVRRLLDSAIVLLGRSDGAVDRPISPRATGSTPATARSGRGWRMECSRSI